MTPQPHVEPYPVAVQRAFWGIALGISLFLWAVIYKAVF